MLQFQFKGTVQLDLLPQIFLQMASSQASYSVSEGFSNLASKFRKYSHCLIDSMLSFIAESWYSLYCLMHIIYSWELRLCEFCAETLACHVIR